MPTTVDIPGVGTVEFPDTMSMKEIEAESAKIHASGPPKQGLNPLVDKIRAKYPGVYDDLDDATLTKKVLAKYPMYSDLAAPHPTVPEPKMQESTIGNVMSSPDEYAASHSGTTAAKIIGAGRAVDKAGQAVTAGNAVAGVATIGGAVAGPFLVRAAQTPMGRAILKEVLKGTIHYEVLKHLFDK